MNPNLPEFRKELIKKRAKSDYASVHGESTRSIRSVGSAAPSSSGVNGPTSKKAVRFGETKSQRQYHEPENWDENTVHGPIQNPSLIRRGCDSCVSFAGKVCYFLPCKCPGSDQRETQEDYSNVEDVHEAPGVTLATKTKATGVGISVGGKPDEESKGEDREDIIYKKNVETILDYAAKSLNIKITVDNPELLNEAVALLGTRVRSIQPRIEEEQQSHLPGETFYAGKGFKPGTWRSNNWNARFFKLQYDGSLKYYTSETDFNAKGVFTITKESIVEQPVMQNGKYMVTIKNGFPDKFIIGLSSIEDATMWAGHFRSIIDFKAVQTRPAQTVAAPQKTIVTGNGRQAVTPARQAERRPATTATAATAAVPPRAAAPKRAVAAGTNPAYYHTANNANPGNGQRHLATSSAERARQDATSRSVMSELSK